LLVFKTWKNLKEVNEALEVETKTVIDSIIVNRERTLLDIASITSRDKKESI
jgi:hypothetical protein